MKKSTIIILLLSCLLPYTHSQVPSRKAIMGINGKAVTGGIAIDSVTPLGTFASLGLRKGDILTAMNGTRLPSMQSYSNMATGFRAGDAIEVTFIRDNNETTIKGKALMRPFEQSDFADVQYDWVKFRNGYLRAITRKPKNKVVVPAILLIPGYGCGSIENYMTSYNGKLLTAWVKAGYAVVTIEKSGMGDSYGCEPCSEADLVTDIGSFDAGYRYMEQLPFVDKERLYVWGHSMGGVIAPVVAKLHHPKGVMVFGSTFRPWNEFLLEMHRIQKPLLENQTYQQTEAFIRKIRKIYYEFFILKRSPQELYQQEEYKELVESELTYKKGSNDMWGRHWRFWQQIDSLNLTQSWQAVGCPVLILHGETDYEQCSRAEPFLMQQTINASHPGNATMLVVPQLDHFMMKSATWEAARDNFREQQYAKGNFNEAIATETINWLRQH